VQIIGKVSGAVASLTNTAPVFESELVKDLTLTVTKNGKGIIVDSSDFIYRSPVAIDKESNAIEMSFTGLEKLLGSSIKKNSDDTFTLKIGKILINKMNSGKFTLTVELGDEIKPKASSHSIEVSITYIEEELDPIPEKNEP